MKWLFLLGQEASRDVGPSFYEFVPYKFGPFSFQAYRDISSLESNGFLQADELNIPPPKRKEAWSELHKLSTRTSRAISEVLSRYGNMSTDRLIEDVYSRYPWYASRSQLRPRRKSKTAQIAVYTVGYEGRTIDGLLDHLLRSGIRRLVDVRKNAMSRKYGFAGKTIARLCEDVDIDYKHVPSVGIPSSFRTDLSSADDYERLFDKYEREILPDAGEGISSISRLCSEKPSALMCYEASPKQCHRGRLAPKVAESAHLKVKHL